MASTGFRVKQSNSFVKVYIRKQKCVSRDAVCTEENWYEQFTCKTANICRPRHLDKSYCNVPQESSTLIPSINYWKRGVAVLQTYDILSHDIIALKESTGCFTFRNRKYPWDDTIEGQRCEQLLLTATVHHANLYNSKAYAKNTYTCSNWAENRYILKQSKNHATSGVFGPWESLFCFIFLRLSSSSINSTKYQYAASKILMGNSFWVFVWFINMWVLWLFSWSHSLTIIQHYDYYTVCSSYIRRA